MSKEEFSNHLDSILRLLEKGKGLRLHDKFTEKKIERSQLSDFLMNKIVELYLLGKIYPDYKEDPKYQDFIRNSGSTLRILTSEIVDYIIKIENELRESFYSVEQWKNHICWRRSAVEALKEMYKDTPLKELYYELDTEDLDDSIEMRAHKEGGLEEEQIPKGIPTSHWWWWSPQLPPNDRNIMNQTVQIN